MLKVGIIGAGRMGNAHAGNLAKLKSASVTAVYDIDPAKSAAFKEKYPESSFFGDPDINGYYWIDYLSGSSRLREMIIEGKNSRQIKDSWKEDVERFRVQRRPYLIYPE